MSEVSDIANTILEGGRQRADAMQRAAAIRAQATANSGQIWGQALSNLGQQIGSIPAQMQQQKITDLQTKNLGLEVQQRQDQVTAAQQAQQAQSRANQVIGSLPRSEDGTFDTSSLIQKLAQANVPLEHQEKFASAIDGVNKVIQSFNLTKRDHAADLANVLLQNHDAGQPVTADSVHLGLAAARAAGLASQADEDQFTKALGQGADPGAVLKTIRGLGSKYAAEKPVVVGEGGSLVDPQTGTPLFTAPKKPIDVPRGGTLVNPDTGATIATGAPEPTKGLQSENVLLDGKPAKVNFSPETGKYTDTTGADVSPRIKPLPPASITYPNPQGDQAVKDVKEAVAGMKDGTLPPVMPGRATKEYLATMAEAHRQGYDLAAAATDWAATQKHIATMNGAQQLRLNQSINALPDLLDSVESLAGQWKAGRFPLLNKASLALAKGGAFGKDAATIANQLDSQIADVTADLGNVYMGGNSPTDQALGLAGKSLNANWDAQVLKNMVDLARKNVTIRQNSIKHTGVAGASDANPYVPKTGASESAPKPTGRFNPATGKIEAVAP